jgi:hypothetical protein
LNNPNERSNEERYPIIGLKRCENDCLELVIETNRRNGRFGDVHS